MASKNSIQVAIKVRPLLSKEKDVPCYWRVVENSITQLKDGASEPYYFDHIFDQDVRNQIIFDKMAKNIVHSAIHGFNGTIFAYGQTSSGKTYTMMGDEQNSGVMVLAAEEIFKEIEKTTDRRFLLRVKYIEIYNEKLYDLLNKKNVDIKIHETTNGTVIVSNCEEHIITSQENLLHYLCMGNKERTVGETNLNERSSRSHAIFRIIIESQKMDKLERSKDDAITQSILNLVDLAGSERADQSGARGARLKEGGHINKSLLFLSNVIKQLSENENEKFISYRDSKLTRILQASLGGNALTSIICTIKPTTVEETQSTLNFAMRAKCIKNKPQVNEIISDATMMKRLERKIKDLETHLAEERSKNKSQIKVGQLEQSIKNEILKITSANSLQNIRMQKEKRRRTWCSAPSSVSAESALQPLQQQQHVPATLMAPPIPSRLPSLPRYAKCFTPQITMRISAADKPPSLLPQPKNNNNTPLIVELNEEAEEHFEPSENCNFEMLSPHSNNRLQAIDFRTPDNGSLNKLSLTPQIGASIEHCLETMKHDFRELQEFTNLEKKIDVNHDTYGAMKQQLETLTHRNATLEKERIDFINGEIEHASTKESLKNCEKRCDELQITISKLTTSNQAANTKIAKYEQELIEFNETIEKLQVENREAVNMDFEFSRHKNKTKLRENELLEAISEKDKEIAKLEKTLNSVTNKKLRVSIEDLIELSRGSIGETLIETDGSVCVKCEDIKRLLDENRKVQIEFEKLTLAYKELQLNYTLATEETARHKQDDTTEHTVANLLLEINALNEKLSSQQQENEKLRFDLEQLTMAHEDLNLNYKLAKEEAFSVQVNFAELKEKHDADKSVVVNLRLEIAAFTEKINKIQEENLKVQFDFEKLTRTHEELQLNYTQTTEEAASLQTSLRAIETQRDEGELTVINLRLEVASLNKKLEKIQQEYDSMKCELATKYQDYEMANDVSIEELRKMNEKYKSLQTLWQNQTESINEIQTEYQTIQLDYKNLQSEYAKLEQTSTQSLKDCEKFQDTNKALQMEVNDLKARVERAQNQLPEVNEDSTEVKQQNEKLVGELAELQRQFEDLQREYDDLSNQLMDSLQEEETLRDQYKKLETKLNDFMESSGNKTAEAQQQSEEERKNLETEISGLKSQLSGWFAKNKSRSSRSMDFESSQKDSYSGESMKSSGVFMDEDDVGVIDIQSNSMTSDKTDTLKESIIELNAQLKRQLEHVSAENERLRDENKSILESTERNINEMREEITKLSSELFEKSLFLEKCACEEYQSQIKSLKQECLDVTIICEELQDKMTTKDGNDTLCDDTEENKTQLKLQVQQLVTQSKDIEKRCVCTKATIKVLQEELVNAQTICARLKEQLAIETKKYDDECKRLQLELYEKLETNENEFRETLRKSNREWEDCKDGYEKTIDSLRLKLESHSEICINCSALQTELNNKETILQQLKETVIKDITQLKEDRIEIENNSTHAEERISVLEKEYNETIKKHKKLLELNQKLITEGEVLKAAHDNLLKSNDKQERILELTEVLNGVKNNLVELEQVNGRLKNENTMLKREQNVNKEWLQDAHDKLRNADLNFSEVDNTLNELKVQNNILTTEKEKIQKEHDKLLESIQDQEYKQTLLQDNILKLKEMELKISELAVKNEKLVIEKEILKKEHNKLIRSQQDQENIQQSLKDELLKLREVELKFKDVNDKLNELIEVNSKLQIERNNIQAERDEAFITYDNNLVENCKKITEANTLNKSLLAEKEVLQNQHEELIRSNEQQVKTLETQLYNLEEVFKQIVIEKSELQNQFESKDKEIQDSQAKLLESQEKLNDELKTVKNLTVEKCQLQDSIEALKSEYENALQVLKQDKENLCMALEQQRQQRIAIKESEATLLSKIEMLTQELQETKTKTLAVEMLHSDHAQLEKLLATAKNDKATLCQQIHALEKTLNDNQRTAEENADSIRTEVQELKIELLAADGQIKNLLVEKQHLKSQVADVQATLQKQKQEQESLVAELELKCKTLQEANWRLQSCNNVLDQQVQIAKREATECQTLQQELKRLTTEHDELERRLKRSVAEADQCRRVLEKDVSQHKEILERNNHACNSLRNLLATKESAFRDEKVKLENTVSCLLLEKKTLEEKLHLNQEITMKLESELTQRVKQEIGNTSVESNNSFSPHGRKSIDRFDYQTLKSFSAIADDKISPMQQKASMERKNRRLSTHDERRSQSFWGMTRDVASMTDPSDKSCNCAELDNKLRESERNLFIRESQVTALTFELKNHPLKAQNAALLKRLQDEQEAHRIEMKRYKQNNAEQKFKLVSALEKITQMEKSLEVPPKILANVETQTHCEINEALHVLQGKYTDLKNICRQRGQYIRNLEAEAAVKENNPDPNQPISSLEAGRLKALQRECENHKKDSEIYKNKYEKAKIILNFRLEELKRLRGGAESGVQQLPSENEE